MLLVLETYADYMTVGPGRAVREQIQSDLKDGKVTSSSLILLKDVENLLPMEIGGYSDFYTSLEHCQNVC